MDIPKIFRRSSTLLETRVLSTVLTAHDVVSDAAVDGTVVQTQKPANPRETTYLDRGDHKACVAVGDEKNRPGIRLWERPTANVEETDENRGLLINGRTVLQNLAHNRWPDDKVFITHTSVLVVAAV